MATQVKESKGSLLLAKSGHDHALVLLHAAQRWCLAVKDSLPGDHLVSQTKVIS